MKTIPYSKFKHGQRVTCEIDGKKVDDAKISIDPDGTVYICQNISLGIVANDRMGYSYSYSIPMCDKFEDGLNDIRNLKFLPRTLDDLKERDVLTTAYGGEKVVLGICGKVYFLSSVTSKYELDDGFTLQEIKSRGFTLKQDEPEEEKPVYTTEYPAIFVSENEDKISYKGKTYILSK